MSKNILIIIGNPKTGSFCHALAGAYRDGATSAGHIVRLLDLATAPFDPVLHDGYRSSQTLEPAVADAQAAITWAQHIVLVYPNWWGTMPALLKGFIDRTFLPGFAFQYRQNSQLWDRLLSGRTARVLVTMDTPPWYYRWIYRGPGHNQIRRTILEFCGIKPVAITSLGPIRSASPAKRQTWLAGTRDLGFSAS